MEILQQSGLVTLYDYKQVEKLELYQSLQRSSERFRQSRALNADPFHQWSRRWEYPWVAQKIARKGPEKILDAGCGLTFFPFYLTEHNPEAEIACVDSDKSLAKSYENTPRLKFTAGELQKLPYGEAEFDTVYCISVLEHTGEFEKIASEFKRVLKPGGQLLVTFDICLNGVAEISPRGAEDLIRVLNSHFKMQDPNEVQVGDLKRPSGLIRTDWISRNIPSSMPWKYPALTALKAGLTHGKWPRIPDLTFCTLAMFRE